MRRILRGPLSRQTSTGWLIVSAFTVLAVLSLASLRVSATPEAAASRAKIGSANKTSGSPLLQSATADPAAKPAAAGLADQPVAPSTIKLDQVSWGRAVNGLQPGFLLTAPIPGKNRRLMLNTLLDYEVLVRNVTNREIYIDVRRGGPDPWVPAPYFIPDADLSEALRANSIPASFHASGLIEMSEIVPTYELNLAAGEAVVVPHTWPFGARGLYIGNSDKGSYPRIETVKAGANWIVQPITIRLLTQQEKEVAEGMMQPASQVHATVTTIYHGTTRQSPAAVMGARSEGKQLLASMKIDVH